MKVLLINGSPKEKGCVWTGLREVEKSLNEENIDTEIFHIGSQPISDCVECGKCADGAGCVIKDVVDVVFEKAQKADGFIIGSPVYFAGINGSLKSLLDRLFYAYKSIFAFKPGAAMVSARRAGTTAALEQLNKYLMISQMIVVSSQYWNMVHGNTPQEVAQDLEGMQVMRILGKNTAWLLKCIEQAKKSGIELPKFTETKARTNFIR